MTAKVFWPIFTILMTVLLALLWYVGWNIFYYIFCFENHLPDSGQWWCEELQLMLSCDDGVYSHYIDDGQTKLCIWWAEHRSNDIYVNPLDTEQEPYMADFRTVIFSGYSIRCRDGRMTVEEHDTNARYTFVLVNEPSA